MWFSHSSLEVGSDDFVLQNRGVLDVVMDGYGNCFLHQMTSELFQVGRSLSYYNNYSENDISSNSFLNMMMANHGNSRNDPNIFWGENGFPITQWIGLIMLVIALIFVSRTGLGGGALIIPINLILMGWPLSYVSALTNVAVFGGSIANWITYMGKYVQVTVKVDRWVVEEHQRKQKGSTTIVTSTHGRPSQQTPTIRDSELPTKTIELPVVDWEIILMMEPSTMLGTVIGTYINQITPPLIATPILVVFIGVMGIQTIFKSLQIRKREKAEVENEVEQNKGEDYERNVSERNKGEVSERNKGSNNPFTGDEDIPGVTIDSEGYPLTAIDYVTTNPDITTLDVRVSGRGSLHRSSHRYVHRTSEKGISSSNVRINSQDGSHEKSSDINIDQPTHSTDEVRHEPIESAIHVKSDFESIEINTVKESLIRKERINVELSNLEAENGPLAAQLEKADRLEELENGIEMGFIEDEETINAIRTEKEIVHENIQKLSERLSQLEDARREENEIVSVAVLSAKSKKKRISRQWFLFLIFVPVWFTVLVLIILRGSKNWSPLTQVCSSTYWTLAALIIPVTFGSVFAFRHLLLIDKKKRDQREVREMLRNDKLEEKLAIKDIEEEIEHEKNQEFVLALAQEIIEKKIERQSIGASHQAHRGHGASHLAHREHGAPENAFQKEMSELMVFNATPPERMSKKQLENDQDYHREKAKVSNQMKREKRFSQEKNQRNSLRSSTSNNQAGSSNNGSNQTDPIDNPNMHFYREMSGSDTSDHGGRSLFGRVVGNLNVVPMDIVTRESGSSPRGLNPGFGFQDSPRSLDSDTIQSGTVESSRSLDSDTMDSQSLSIRSLNDSGAIESPRSLTSGTMESPRSLGCSRIDSGTNSPRNVESALCIESQQSLRSAESPRTIGTPMKRPASIQSPRNDTQSGIRSPNPTASEIPSTTSMHPLAMFRAGPQRPHSSRDRVCSPTSRARPRSSSRRRARTRAAAARILARVNPSRVNTTRQLNAWNTTLSSSADMSPRLPVLCLNRCVPRYADMSPRLPVLCPREEYNDRYASPRSPVLCLDGDTHIEITHRNEDTQSRNAQRHGHHVNDQRNDDAHTESNTHTVPFHPFRSMVVAGGQRVVALTPEVKQPKVELRASWAPLSKEKAARWARYAGSLPRTLFDKATERRVLLRDSMLQAAETIEYAWTKDGDRIVRNASKSSNGRTSRNPCNLSSKSSTVVGYLSMKSFQKRANKGLDGANHSKRLDDFDNDSAEDNDDDDFVHDIESRSNMMPRQMRQRRAKSLPKNMHQSRTKSLANDMHQSPAKSLSKKMGQHRSDLRSDTVTLLAVRRFNLGSDTATILSSTPSSVRAMLNDETLTNYGENQVMSLAANQRKNVSDEAYDATEHSSNPSWFFDCVSKGEDDAATIRADHAGTIRGDNQIDLGADLETTVENEKKNANYFAMEDEEESISDGDSIKEMYENLDLAVMYEAGNRSQYDDVFSNRSDPFTIGDTPSNENDRFTIADVISFETKFSKSSKKTAPGSSIGTPVIIGIPEMIPAIGNPIENTSARMELASARCNDQQHFKDSDESAMDRADIDLVSIFPAENSSTLVERKKCDRLYGKLSDEQKGPGKENTERANQEKKGKGDTSPANGIESILPIGEENRLPGGTGNTIPDATGNTLPDGRENTVPPRRTALYHGVLVDPDAFPHHSDGTFHYYGETGSSRDGSLKNSRTSSCTNSRASTKSKVSARNNSRDIDAEHHVEGDGQYHMEGNHDAVDGGEDDKVPLLPNRNNRNNNRDSPATHDNRKSGNNSQDITIRDSITYHPQHSFDSGSAINWNSSNTLTFPVIVIFAGIIAGAFGLGGGVIKGPIMLSLGVHPRISTATAAVMIFFTSSTACVSNIIAGLIPWHWGLVMFFLGFGSTLFGSWLMQKIFKSQWLIVLNMALVFIIAFVAIVARFAIDLALHNKNGEMMEAKGIC